MNDQKPPFAQRPDGAPAGEQRALESGGDERWRCERPELGLPGIDLPPERVERIRRRAHAILRAEQAAPPVGSLAWRYQRSVEPALLIGLGLCQAIWAIHGTWQLLR